MPERAGMTPGPVTGPQNPSQPPPGPVDPSASASADARKMPTGANAPKTDLLSDFAQSPEAAPAPKPAAPAPAYGSGRYLVVVESPSKAKTLSGYLGRDYKVLASVGHVRDIPAKPVNSRFGVDLKTWTPEYEVNEAKKSAIDAILNAAAKAEKVYIASDPDREGEAIAWHIQTLMKAAGVDPAKTARATWREITKEGVEKGLATARQVDMAMVHSQEARRILDRVVGYTLSPWLGRQLGVKGLSAGRVQSAALQEVVARDAERANHVPISYGAVNLTAEAEGKSFKMSLTKAGGLQVVGPEKEGKPGTVMLTDEAMKNMTLPKAGDKLYVIACDTKPMKTAPKPPFTTTTLVVAASNGMGLNTERTMQLAQKLYERGLITYHRSDSPTVSEKGQAMARAHIAKEFGADYLPEKPRQYKAKGENAQEAHECVRPAHLEPEHAKETREKLDELVKAHGPEVETLYHLIERRFVACQMADKRYDSTTAHLGFGGGEKSLVFKANGNITRFDGFTRVFAEDEGEEKAPKDAPVTLPALAKGMNVTVGKCDTTTKKTAPKPSYTEATLTTDLEALGIGRPSTYAATFATLHKRGYVETTKEGNRNNVLKATELGQRVIEKLRKEFPREMDSAYTAAMETDLDRIAGGKLAREAFLDANYADLKKHNV